MLLELKYVYIEVLIDALISLITDYSLAYI